MHSGEAKIVRLGMDSDKKHCCSRTIAELETDALFNKVDIPEGSVVQCSCSKYYILKTGYPFMYGARRFSSATGLGYWAPCKAVGGTYVH